MTLPSWLSKGPPSFSLSDIVDRTGAPQRSVLHWSASGALLAEGDNAPGRGFRRRYSYREVEVAAVLAALGPFRLPIGVLVEVGRVVRGGVSINLNPPDEDEWQYAARQPGALLLIVPSGDGDDQKLAVSISTARPDAPAAIVVDFEKCWERLAR